MGKYFPKFDFRKIETWRYDDEVKKAIIRKNELEKQTELSTDDYKELGKIEYIIKSLKETGNTLKDELKIYKVQLAIDTSNGKLYLYYNSKANRERRKNILGYINRELEFEKKEYTFGKLDLAWNAENGYVPIQFQVWDEKFILSQTGEVTYENMSTGLKKTIVDLKTVDFNV
ncbi:hypothetical protein [Maribellus sediminis]|uniref:hypothetical protein n=1 Tax=Maribellus sediminis TaxID=2696285 RepID=UPI001431763B|nr:hypothetical protein [Maribellus sediminis]